MRKENMGKLNKKGFTLAELLIVVAIIAVLVGVSIPIFTSQLEKSREATDLANVRSAYAEVLTAAMIEDTSSPAYVSPGLYQNKVLLKQKQNGWKTDVTGKALGGIALDGTDPQHCKGVPKANGICRVYYEDDQMFLNWGNQDHINTISAADFLTIDILKEIVGESYGYNVINSNETRPNGATKKFLEYAKKNGFDLAEYGAETWQIMVKGTSAGSTTSEFLNDPAIYWSTFKLTDDMVSQENTDVYVPVIGYRDGKYDVYRAKVVKYDSKEGNQSYPYLSLSNGFANVTNAGGSATFQFNSYEEAKAAYDKLADTFSANGNITSSDLSNAGV